MHLDILNKAWTRHRTSQEHRGGQSVSESQAGPKIGCVRMKRFAVLTIETHRRVGFFWVRRFRELAAAVDEFCSPKDCEYRSIDKPAALAWVPGYTKWKMGVANVSLEEHADEAYVEL